MWRNPYSEYGFAIFEDVVAHVRQAYDLPKWDPLFSMDLQNSKATSIGGWIPAERRPFVHVAIVPMSCGRYEFAEYAAFATDAVIGEFQTSSWKKIVMALTCHEASHALQYTPGVLGRLRTAHGGEAANDSSAHGKRWRAIYRDLRVRFVNSME